jgi:ankyrin repeat protein
MVPHGADGAVSCLGARRAAAGTRALLDLGAEVDAVRLGAQETALHIAAQANHRQLVELLLERGADPHRRNWRGQRAFDLGCFDLRGRFRYDE